MLARRGNMGSLSGRIELISKGPNLDGDITGNWVVDMADLKVLVFHWLENCE